MRKRDYDLVCAKKKRQFINNLRKKGFTYGFIRRKDEITLLKKRVPHPKDRFKDNVFLDIHFTDEFDIAKNLKKYAGFTINAFAISLSDIAEEKWNENLITIPGALDDLKNKQLRLNAVSHPTMIYACIRFMAQGFKQPSKTDVQKMLRAAGSMNKKSHERRIKKVFNYVGGEQNARKLLMKLGIKRDIFDFNTILAIRKEVKKNPEVILD